MSRSKVLGRWALAVTAALAGLGMAGGTSARAQNTYADVPFNQGSLFYRPSGARPPQTTRSVAPAPTTTRGNRPRRFRRRANATVAPTRYYVMPGGGYVPTNRVYYVPRR